MSSVRAWLHAVAFHFVKTSHAVAGSTLSRFRPGVDALDDRCLPAPLVVAAPQQLAAIYHPAPGVGAEGAGLQNGIDPARLNELAAALGTDSWSRMPHTAEDDYVRHSGTWLRDRLDLSPKACCEIALTAARR